MPNVKQIAIRKPSVGSTRDAPGAAVSFAAVKYLQADLRCGKIVCYFLIRPSLLPLVLISIYQHYTKFDFFYTNVRLRFIHYNDAK